MENDQMACRCDGCRSTSTNGSGLLWHVPTDMSLAVPIRDLENGHPVSPATGVAV